MSISPFKNFLFLQKYLFYICKLYSEDCDFLKNSYYSDIQ